MRHFSHLVLLSFVVFIALILEGKSSVLARSSISEISVTRSDARTTSDNHEESSRQLYFDGLYGFSVELPSHWRVSPAVTEGTGGVTQFANFDFGYNSTHSALEEGDIKVDIGVFTYDKPPDVGLSEWTQIDPDIHDIQFEDQWVTLAGAQTLRRDVRSSSSSGAIFMVPRGTKVYFLAVMPLEAVREEQVTKILGSFQIQLPYSFRQRQVYRLYPGSESLPSRVPDAPAGYRLPFVGWHTISTGPGCYETHQDLSFEAIDFGQMPENTPIYTTQAGDIVYAVYGYNGGFGNLLKIRHDDGHTSWYGHLNSFARDSGRVNWEDLVAYSGNTGYSSGPHLHFEVRDASNYSVWIRDLPGITWYSGDPNNPCQPPGYNDGEADGPELGNGGACDAPSLIEPNDGATLSERTVTFRWNAVSGCTFNGYTFRVCTSSNVDDLASCFIDTGVGDTQRTETISGHDNQDLYWGVRAANASSGASWAVRRFRISPITCPTDGVVLYYHNNFNCDGRGENEGYVQRTSTGFQNISGGINDQSSSIRVPSGWSVKMWEHADRGGGVACRSTSDEDFADDTFNNGVALNDRVSSFEVFNYNACLTVPDAPSLSSPANNTYFAENQSIQLCWNGVQGATEYQGHFVGGPGWDEYSGWSGNLCWTIPTPWAGYSYQWNAQARNGIGTSSWSESRAFHVRPHTPTNLSATVVSDNQVNLSWTDNSGAETAYEVYRDGTRIASLSSDAQSYQDSGVACGRSHNYQVKAVGNGVDSESSNTVNVATPSCPGPVTYESHTVDDDMSGNSWGNGNGTLECRETAEISIRLRNQGADVTGVNLAVSSNDSLVSFPDTTTSSYPDIPAGGSALNDNDFETRFDLNTPNGHTAQLNLLVNSDQGTWTDTLDVTVNCQSPANDDIGSATAISSTPYNGTTDITRATTAADDPILACLADKGHYSVWYRYTAPEDGSLILDSSGSAYDTALALWTGSRGNLQAVGCNDDNGSSSQARLITNVSGGITYYIEAAAANAAGYGTLQLTADFMTIPVLLSPKNGAHLHDNTPSFFWQAVPGSDRYQLQVDDNGDFSSTAINEVLSNTSYTTPSAFAEGRYYWRVRARNSSDGSWGMYSPPHYFVIDRTPPESPLLLSPADGMLTQDTTPTFDWTTIADATAYRLLIDNNVTFSSPERVVGTSSSGFTPNQSLPDATYHWKVRAQDAAGNWSDYSEVRSVTIDTTPPPLPALVSPANGAMTRDTTPTFDWAPPTGAVAYRLLIDNNVTFSSPERDVGTASSGFTPNQSLPDGTYYWKVRARDTIGNWSDYSEVHSVTIDTTPPPLPALVSPIDGTMTQDTTPTFDWAPPTGAVAYRLLIDNNVTFSSPERVVGTSSSGFTPNQSLPDATYHWKVRAQDAAGNWSDYSEVRSVTIDTTPPPLPALVSPANGAMTRDTTPTFDWAPPTGAVAYRLLVDNNVTFSSPERDVETSSSGFAPATSLIDGTYYWKVRARDAAGNWSDYSELRSVTIDTTPPPLPALVSPSDGAMTRDTTPIFDWAPPTGAVAYRLLVDNNVTFSSPERDVTTGNTGYTPSSSLPDGTYYWKVRAQDTIGNWSDYSAVRSVTIDTTPPPLPALVSPTDGIVTRDTTPTFDWAPPTGATHYRFQLDENSNFSAPVVDFVTGSSGYTTSSALDDDTYYWRVQARDAAGNWSSFSPTWRVTLDTTPPEAPALVSPMDNVYTRDSTPIFDWAPAADFEVLKASLPEDATLSGRRSDETSSYRLLVDNGPAFSSPVLDVTTSSTGYAPSSSLLDGTYYWKVQAVDSVGNWSEFSSVWQLTVETDDWMPPPVPALVAPADKVTLNDNTPTFQWQTVSDAVEYEWQGATSAGFTAPQTVRMTTATYTPGTAMGDGTYYWRVRARDAIGNWSAYASSWQITIDHTPPGVPVLSAPENSSFRNEPVVTFSWQARADAVSYQLQLDTEPTFAHPDSFSLVGTFYNVPGPLADDTYYWRVRAQDATGNWSPYSSIWSVTVDTVAPVVPEGLRPLSGSEISDSQPTFQWQTADGGTRYRIQVYRVGEPAPTLDVLVADTFYRSARILGEGTYTWRVRAEDDAGNSSEWSDSCSLFIVPHRVIFLPFITH